MITFHFLGILKQTAVYDLNSLNPKPETLNPKP